MISKIKFYDFNFTEPKTFEEFREFQEKYRKSLLGQ